MTTLTRAEIVELVKRQCEDLDPALICALIEQESGFDPWAIRFEPGFLNRYVIPLGLRSMTESEARAFSWGLLQLMGQCARELGYAGPLAQLCDPETNIFWGMRHLRNKMSTAGNDIRKALLLWNGGGNSHYPDEVLSRVPRFTLLPADPRDVRGT